MQVELVERITLTPEEEKVLREAWGILAEVYALAMIGRPLEKAANRGASAINEILNNHTKTSKEGR